MASNDTNLLSYGIVGQKPDMGLRTQSMAGDSRAVLSSGGHRERICFHPWARNSLTPSSKPTILYLFNHYSTVTE